MLILFPFTWPKDMFLKLLYVSCILVSCGFRKWLLKSWLEFCRKCRAAPECRAWGVCSEQGHLSHLRSVTGHTPDASLQENHSPKPKPSSLSAVSSSCAWLLCPLRVLVETHFLQLAPSKPFKHTMACSRGPVNRMWGGVTGAALSCSFRRLAAAQIGAFHSLCKSRNTTSKS